MRQISENGRGHYFCVELPNGKRLFHNAIKKSGTQQQRFPIHIARYVLLLSFQFMTFLSKMFVYIREVLASPKLLNVEDRIDWKKCDQSQDEETSDVNLFRCAFAPYNPIKD